MMNLLASAVAGFGLVFGGLFGHPSVAGPMHPGNSFTASSTVNSHAPMPTSEVIGKVASITGSSLTVIGRMGAYASTTYTVDATSAKVTMFAQKGSSTTPNTDMTITDVKVGDNILLLGSVSGTNVLAKRVVDGLPSKYLRPMLVMKKVEGKTASSSEKSTTSSIGTQF